MRLSLIVALLASSFVAPWALAQEGGQSRSNYVYAPGSSENRITPTLGLTMNKLTNGTNSTENDTGFIGGMGVDMGASSTVFHTGALIAQYNTKVKTATLSNLYLSVPAQGKTFFQGGQEGVFARYGVNVNILLSAKGKDSNGNSSDAKSDQNTLDLQGALGLGLAIPLNSTDMVFDISYNRSLMNIARTSLVSIYNETVIFSAGITL